MGRHHPLGDIISDILSRITGDNYHCNRRAHIILLEQGPPQHVISPHVKLEDALFLPGHIEF